jgi:hypothetical protein
VGNATLGVDHPLGHPFRLRIRRPLDEVVVVVPDDEAVGPDGQRMVVAGRGIPASVIGHGSLGGMVISLGDFRFWISTAAKNDPWASGPGRLDREI